MVKVIAEIGCNHKGNFNIAKEMIKVASNCGASIVKFQKRNNLKLLGKKAYNIPHPVESNSYGKTYGLHRDFLEFNINQHKEAKSVMNKWKDYIANYHDLIENGLKIKGKYKIKFDQQTSNKTKKRTNNSELVELLEKLDELYKSNVLTKDEFIKAKEKLINQYN